MKLNKRVWFQLLLVLGSGIVLGLILAAFSPGDYLSGAWRSALFCAILVSLFCLVFWYLKPPKLIMVVAVCAFLLRIGLGTWLMTSLPTMGYDTPVQNAGYVYSDAYERDQIAYMKAFSERWDDFNPEDFTGMDQYGGMTAISVGIYRLFSADVQRPLLLIYFAAFFMSIGILFLWKAIQIGWGERIALISCIVMAAYPEGVLLGSSQMREPLLIGLASLTFWVTMDFSKGFRRPLLFILFGMATLLTCWISIPAGLVILLVEAGYLFVIRIIGEQDTRRRKILGGIFALFLIMAAYVGWRWLKETLYFDAYTTETESGLITWILGMVGKSWRFPFVLLYGLIQPVLPAALVYQSLPVWQGIAIFRAIGWYLVIPFVLYGFGAVIKDARKNRDWGLAWLISILVIWVFVSSARAGGDQWDNPRYRAIFLPWLALLVGWVWDRICRQRASWFWRIVLLEGIFVLIFSNWYVNRKFGTGLAIPIQYLLVFYVVFTVVTIAGGIVLDHRRKKTLSSPKPE
jgi:hypothetical protein